MTQEQWQKLYLRPAQRTEVTVANWLLVTDGAPGQSVAEYLKLPPVECKAKKWVGRNGAYLQETTTHNRQRVFWHMQGRESACDLLFYLRDVPCESLLGRMVLGKLNPESSLAVEPFRDTVKKQNYVKVEVKRSQHSHYEKGRAAYEAFAAETTSRGKPSGWSASQADLAVCAVRNYCDLPHGHGDGLCWCGDDVRIGGKVHELRCEERKPEREKTHPNDSRDNYGYYVLVLSVLKHLMAENEAKGRVKQSNEGNKATNVLIPLDPDLRDHTFLREYTAKKTAKLLPPPDTYLPQCLSSAALGW